MRKDIHPYEIYLALNDIEHRTIKVRKPQTNGFVERFNRTTLEEFFRTPFRTKLYESAKALQEDLDQWLCITIPKDRTRVIEIWDSSY